MIGNAAVFNENVSDVCKGVWIRRARFLRRRLNLNCKFLSRNCFYGESPVIFCVSRLVYVPTTANTNWTHGDGRVRTVECFWQINISQLLSPAVNLNYIQCSTSYGKGSCTAILLIRPFDSQCQFSTDIKDSVSFFLFVRLLVFSPTGLYVWSL